jgi:hypothetical protein
MAFDSGFRKIRDVAERDLDCGIESISECTESGTEN